MRNAFKMLVGKLQEKRPARRSGADGWVILKCILNK